MTDDRRHTDRFDRLRADHLRTDRLRADHLRADHLRAAATCAVLGVVVLALGLLCWFAPKDTYSESERRPLGKAPALTVGSLASGRFMEQFEAYAQDAFPVREASRTAKALASERLFRKMDNNGLYTAPVAADGLEGTGIVAMEYPLNEASVQRAAERFRWVYEQYVHGTQANVYLSIVPDKNYYFAQESGHLALEYEKLFALMEDGMPYATYLDVASHLNAGSYYRTDPHWRQEALVAVAAALLEGMGADGGVSAGDALAADDAADDPAADAAQTGAAADASYSYVQHVATTEFYGSYYGQAALPLQPDTLVYLANETIDAATAYDHEHNRALPLYDTAAVLHGEDASEAGLSLSDAELAEGSTPTDPYDLFLGGALSLVTVESPLARTDRELVIFRDSFASSLAPLLLDRYAKVTLVDLRYLQPAMLGDYVTFTDQDVLFLFSTSTLNHAETIR